MAVKQTTIITNYNNEIKSLITNSGGTVIFVHDNMIIASEISEEQYRNFLVNPYIDKIDIVSMKSYGYAQPSSSGSTYTIPKTILNATKTTDTSLKNNTN